MKKRFLAFEVFLNGKRLCLAGMPKQQVLTAILSWSGRGPLPPLSHRTYLDGMHLHVGGLHEPKRGAAAHTRWASLFGLKVGDKVSVRLVATRAADPPRLEKPLSADYVREQEFKHYLKLKRRFERHAERATVTNARRPRAG